MDPEQEIQWLLQQRSWAENADGPLRWAMSLDIKTETGEPMEYSDRGFMIDIFCDMHPLQVMMKCSQVGATTFEILKAYFLAQVMNRRIIYSLPTATLVEDLNTTKLEPIESHNPKIIAGVTNNKKSKSWGKGFILFRGTRGEAQDVMVSADYIIADEVNHSDISVVEGLESRLSASKIQAQWWFGHPTSPGIGVDLKWQESDQREWHVKCRGCGDEQPLDFWQNVDSEREIYVCRACNEHLTDDDRRAGRWIATVDEVDGKPPKWHGYHISHLIAPWIPCWKVIEAEKKAKEYFFSKVLGLPYIGGGGSVDPSLIRNAQIYPMPEEFRPLQKFIGVDVGGPLHVVIGNERGITKCLLLKDDPGIKPEDATTFVRDGKPVMGSKWGKLHQLMLMEQPNLVVIDNAPSGKQQVAFQKLHPLHVLRCIYDYDNRRQEDWEKEKGKGKEGTINANRTRIIDTVLGAFGNGEIPVYMEPDDIYFDGEAKKTSKHQNCLVHHWSALYQVGGDGQDVNIVKKDRMGNVIRTWENSGPDHFCHASVYYYLARMAGRYSGTGTGGFMPGTGGGGGGGKKREPLDEDDDFDGEKPGLTFYGM